MGRGSATTAGSAPSAAAVVPRWEWRSFGAAFGKADEVLGAVEPDRVHESDELYVLSRAGDASVKVRDELMDVKQLQRVDAEGLEQWLPILKAPFPLDASAVAVVLAALGAAPGPLDRERYTHDEFLTELVEPDPGLAAVAVHKRRARYTVAGCSGELTEVRTAAGSTRTLAVESADAAAVGAARSELGVSSSPNVAMARGLKELTAFGAPRFGALDVGSNSVKLCVGARRADGGWVSVSDRSVVTRLGEGLAQTGELGAVPIARTVEAIAELVADAHRAGVGAIAAAGTAALRIAPNSELLLAAVRERCGIEIEIVSGEEEARLAYVAVAAGIGVPDAPLVVFDTGGGSSQFTFGHGVRVDERFSLPIGAVRLTERYGLEGVVGDDELSAARQAIAADFERLDGRSRPDAVIGIGGAVTNLTAVRLGLAEYDPNLIRGAVLEADEVERQIELYRSRTTEERREIVGLQESRAPVILAGACIVRAVMEKLGCASLTVSDRGLRHGLLAERFADGA
jgi:exopolyphosphatase / guanosine-5'-triphosphate,3'-diphosphate pyrophosphatase